MDLIKYVPNQEFFNKLHLTAALHGRTIAYFEISPSDPVVLAIFVNSIPPIDSKFSIDVPQGYCKIYCYKSSDYTVHDHEITLDCWDENCPTVLAGLTWNTP